MIVLKKLEKAFITNHFNFSVKHPHRNETFHFFLLHTKRKRGICCWLLDSLGPGKTRTTNKQLDTHAFNRGASTAVLFLLVLIEFSRFKEYKNKLGKRLLSICRPRPDRPLKNLFGQGGYKNKDIFGKNKGFTIFYKDTAILVRF